MQKGATMKNSAVRSIILAVIFGTAMAAFAGPRAERARYEAKRQEKKEAFAAQARRWAHYLSDEGALGAIGWKEFVVNPAAKGPVSLVVVLGGRESIDDEHRPSQPPPALDPLITYAKTGNKGKVVILVPQLPENDGQRAGRRAMRQGPAAPNGGDKLPELVRARVEKHGVPPARVFATGVSMGGHEIYRLLVREPNLFARAVIVGAVGDVEKAGDVQSELRVYHGADDEVIALGRAKAMVDAVNAKNPGRASLVTLKGKRHRDAAEAAYSKSDCWKWLLR